jgi:FixJ family two-component response regulator
MELVTLVAQGHTNAEIAARLYISVRTMSSRSGIRPGTVGAPTSLAWLSRRASSRV